MRLASVSGKVVVFGVIPALLVVLGAGAWFLLAPKAGDPAAGPGAARPAGGAAAGNGASGPEGGGKGNAGADAKTAGKTNGREGEAKEKTPTPVSVAPIAAGPVSSYITSTANLVAEDEVKVLAEAEGRVEEQFVEEGDRVRRGQVLAQLVRQDAEIAVRKAASRAGSARLAYERAVKMVGEELMSPEAYDRIKTDHDVAQQELEEARWRLEKTTIRAPFSGRVTERSIRPGQHVRTGDALFTVADFDPLIARIYLPEKDVVGLREGRPTRITLKADERTRFAGRIRQISPVVDTATGTVKVTIEATEPPPEVRPGAFVTIDIVRETRARAVLVPREAVVRDHLETYVFVAVDGVAARRAVALGLEEGGRIEVLSGVAPGEQVIVAGQGSLKDGAPVKIVPAAEASDLRRGRNARRVG
jgi:membrane fusion protein (multidrug efflux system)